MEASGAARSHGYQECIVSRGSPADGVPRILSALAYDYKWLAGDAVTGKGFGEVCRPCSGCALHSLVECRRKLVSAIGARVQHAQQEQIGSDGACEGACVR